MRFWGGIVAVALSCPAAASAQPVTAAPAATAPAATTAEPDPMLVALVRGGAARGYASGGVELVERPESILVEGDAFTLHFDADDGASTVLVRARKTETGTIALAVTVTRVSTAFRSADVAPADVETAIADAIRDAFAEATPPPPVVPPAPPRPPPPAATAAPLAPPAVIDVEPQRPARDAYPFGFFADLSAGVLGAYGGTLALGQDLGIGISAGWAFGSGFALAGLFHYSGLSIPEDSGAYGGYGGIESTGGSLVLGGIEARGKIREGILGVWGAFGVSTGEGSIDVDTGGSDGTIELSLGAGIHLGFGLTAAVSDIVSLGLAARWFLLPLTDFCVTASSSYGGGGGDDCLEDPEDIAFPDFVFLGALLEISPH